MRPRRSNKNPKPVVLKTEMEELEIEREDGTVVTTTHLVTVYPATPELQIGQTRDFLYNDTPF